MIILICGEKGGTGKTTLATNLAGMRTIQTGDLLLVDADPQLTASLWCSIRNQNRDIQTKITSVQKLGDISKDIESLSNRFEDIIIDAGGFDSMELRSAMLVADVLISPFRPGQFDIWTMSKMDEHIKKAQLINQNLTAHVLISQASFQPAAKQNEVEAMLAHMEDFPNLNLLRSIIVARQAYRKAAITGKIVYELELNDKNAKSEMKQLYAEIFVNRGDYGYEI